MGNSTQILSGLLKRFQYVKLAALNILSQQKLERVPEPFALTESTSCVEDYNRAIDSIMVLPYVLVLDYVNGIMNGSPSSKAALDLCCGPGHFTRLLAKHLNGQMVIGVDLSEPMLKKAQENADAERLSHALSYLKCDVTSLHPIQSKSMDIVTFMDGAHHMPSIQKVTEILKEADRVAKPEGVIILLDPVRPKTSAIANLYHRIAGQPYLDLGLTHFNKDFYDSLMASWTAKEMFEAIPKDTCRKWVQIVPFGFPSFQIVIGLPENQRDALVNRGLVHSAFSHLVPKKWTSDWEMLQLSFRLAKQKVA